jgi:hypothetical protein
MKPNCDDQLEFRMKATEYLCAIVYQTAADITIKPQLLVVANILQHCPDNVFNLKHCEAVTRLHNLFLYQRHLGDAYNIQGVLTLILKNSKAS